MIPICYNNNTDIQYQTVNMYTLISLINIDIMFDIYDTNTLILSTLLIPFIPYIYGKKYPSYSLEIHRWKFGWKFGNYLLEIQF